MPSWTLGWLAVRLAVGARLVEGAEARDKMRAGIADCFIASTAADALDAGKFDTEM